MPRPLVSVVIPVYNAEKYLHRCLDSVLGQTYSGIEIVCVNDGSKDSSLKILRSYQKKHKDIRVIDQVNRGVAAARNTGLDTSVGEFVTFVDSDDAIKPDFVEQLVEAIGGNDVVVSGYERHDGEKVIFTQVAPQSDWALYKFNSTCGKLYRREFLVKHQITFPEQYRIGEDMYFTMEVLAHTTQIRPTRYVGYLNYINHDSITHLANTSKRTRNTKMLDLLRDIERATADSNDIPVNYRLCFYLKSIILHLMTQRHILSDSEYFEEYQKYFAWLKSIYAKYDRKLSFYRQPSEKLAVNTICNIFVLADKTHTTKLLLYVLNHLHIAEIR